MSAKRVRRTAVVGAGMAIVLAGVAFAAAPLPQKGKLYESSTVGKSKVTLLLLVSPSTPKLIEPGVPVLGAAHSGGFIECPNSKSIAEFPFPEAPLLLSHGKYGFTVRRAGANPKFLGKAKKGTLRLVITGTVTSSTTISGTVTNTGSICKTSAVHYTATLHG